jgi:hypothetical protein
VCFVISKVSQWLDKDFFKFLAPKRKKIQRGQECGEEGGAREDFTEAVTSQHNLEG